MPRANKVDTKQRTCPLCKRKFVGKPALVNHIDSAHSDGIPEGWTAARYENYLRTGMTEGHCVYCGKPTGWNESTWKYHRICKDPGCRQKSAANAKKNMKNTYGKEHLLNDPDIQKKMIYAKRNSGTYYFEDPEDPSIKYPAQYDSSYAKDFLEILDTMLNFNGQDVLAPSPNTYMYEYDRSTHFYIPDVYIVSLNLEVEIKDGGTNPNTHPKIVAIDKEKEKLKDAAMYKNRNKVNYIKIVDKNYAAFYAMLSKLKSEDNITYRAKYEKPVPVHEDFTDVIDLVPKDGLLIHQPKAVQRAIKLYNPINSYTGVMQEVGAEIDNIDTPEKYARYERHINDIEDHLKKVRNRQAEEGERLQYEAGRALQYIRTNIRPRLRDKKRMLKQKYPSGKSVPVTEASVPDLLNEKLYQPVYIFLSNAHTPFGKLIGWWTKKPYTHSSISFTEKLAPLYSFIDKGFAVEDIHGGEYQKREDVATYSLYAVMVPTEARDLMQMTVEEFRQNMEKYRYNLVGVANFVFKFNPKETDDKFFCSEFVSHILKQGTDLFKGRSRLSIAPLDLVKPKHVIHIMHGKIRNYNPEKAKETLIKKIQEGKFSD